MVVEGHHKKFRPLLVLATSTSAFTDWGFLFKKVMKKLLILASVAFLAVSCVEVEEPVQNPTVTSSAGINAPVLPQYIPVPPPPAPPVCEPPASCGCFKIAGQVAIKFFEDSDLGRVARRSILTIDGCGNRKTHIIFQDYPSVEKYPVGTCWMGYQGLLKVPSPYTPVENKSKITNGGSPICPSLGYNISWTYRFGGYEIIGVGRLTRVLVHAENDKGELIQILYPVGPGVMASQEYAKEKYTIGFKYLNVLNVNWIHGVITYWDWKN